MMRRILLVLLVLVLGFVGYVSTRPAEFHVERSATIAASASTIYPHLADFHQWEAWSPWERLDPAMKKTYEGDPMGVGSNYHWAGNDSVGEGRMTIKESVPSERLTIELEFIKPFAATNTTLFSLAPEGEGTKVTWAMDGKKDFMMKAVGLFMDMDKQVGGDFERGLASLKQLTEAEQATLGASPDTTATL